MAIKHVLLVDDDEDDQYVFMEALRSVDASILVDCATDGIEALKKLSNSSQPPQLIFLDLNMPRMNGKSFLREIKRSETLNSIPVIVYSTSSNPVDIEETRSLGAQDFITKPNNFRELREVLGRVVG